MSNYFYSYKQYLVLSLVTLSFFIPLTSCGEPSLSDNQRDWHGGKWTPPEIYDKFILHEAKWKAIRAYHIDAVKQGPNTFAAKDIVEWGYWLQVENPTDKPHRIDIEFILHDSDGFEVNKILTYDRWLLAGQIAELQDTGTMDYNNLDRVQIGSLSVSIRCALLCPTCSQSGQ